MSYSPGVAALQVVLNRFSGILKQSHLAVDGEVGPRTRTRFEQVMAAFAPVDAVAWFVRVPATETTAVRNAAITAEAQAWADIFNTLATRMGLTGAKADAPPPAQQKEIEQKIALIPGIKNPYTPWYLSNVLWVGILVVAGGGVGYVAWKKTQGRSRGRSRTRRLRAFA